MLELTNSTLTNALTVAGMLHVRGSSTVAGALENAASGLVLIRGDNFVGGTFLTVNQAWTNHGVVELTSVGNAQVAQLLGASLTNAADGTLNVLAGTGGDRAVN